MSGNQEFVIENGVLTKYTGPGGAVVIPEGVTEIGRQVFQGCTGLTSITLLKGSQLTSIGNNAFYNTGLTDITLPEGLTTIENRTFYQCSSLTSVTLPEGLESIGEYAFRYCTDLTSADLSAASGILCIDVVCNQYQHGTPPLFPQKRRIAIQILSQKAG